MAAQKLRIICDSQSPTNYSCWRFISLIVLHKMLKQQSTWPYAAGYRLPSTSPSSSCFPQPLCLLIFPLYSVTAETHVGSDHREINLTSIKLFGLVSTYRRGKAPTRPPFSGLSFVTVWRFRCDTHPVWPGRYILGTSHCPSSSL